MREFEKRTRKAWKGKTDCKKETSQGIDDARATLVFGKARIKMYIQQAGGSSDSILGAFSGRVTGNTRRSAMQMIKDLISELKDGNFASVAQYRNTSFDFSIQDSSIREDRFNKFVDAVIIAAKKARKALGREIDSAQLNFVITVDRHFEVSIRN